MSTPSDERDSGVERNLPLSDAGIEPSLTTASTARRSVSLRALLLIVPVSIMLGGVVGLYFQPPGLKAFFSVTGLAPGGGTDTPIAVALEQVQTGEKVSVESEGSVLALGRLIPRGDVASVSMPFGSSDARIESVELAVGDIVKRGDVVAVLDNLSQLEASMELASANLQVAEVSLSRSRSANSASLREAQASLLSAEATADSAMSELERVTSLLERGVTTRATFDTVQSTAAQAIREVERARATLSRYTVNGDSLQADIAVAQANVAAARAEQSRARADLERAYVRSPIDGQVLEIHVRPGERPGSEGVVDIGDTSQMSVELEVFQTMIGKISLGDKVVLSARALPQDLTSVVTSIGLQINRQSIIDDDPAANTDARVVEVVATLDEASSRLASKFTNLEVIGRIQTEAQN